LARFGVAARSTISPHRCTAKHPAARTSSGSELSCAASSESRWCDVRPAGLGRVRLRRYRRPRGDDDR
jgi:hypothetical protein